MNHVEVNEEIEIIKVIKDDSVRKLLVDRCGNNIIADGITCPLCGCKETYKDANDIENTDKWFFMIRAFRVDDFSECTNCHQWFGLD